MAAILRKLVIAGAVLVGAYLALAGAMTFWAEPGFATPAVSSPELAAAAGISLEQVYPYEERKFTMRDGEELRARHFAGSSDLTVLLLHGALASSLQYNKSSGMLRDASGAGVLALDLRGHGQSGGRPGDVDYIGQYEDDVVDLVSELRSRSAGGKIVLAGHSMGGGVALRFALKRERPRVDGYLLFAPHLGAVSPTTRTEPPEALPGQEPFVKVHLARILGLIMLNSVGIEAWNQLGTLFYHVPPEYPLHAYSFRAMVSAAPQDHGPALEAVDASLLVLVGSEDEAFHAEHYEATVSAHAEGEVVVLESANHNSIHHDARAIAAAAAWIGDL